MAIVLNIAHYYYKYLWKPAGGTAHCVLQLRNHGNDHIAHCMPVATCYSSALQGVKGDLIRYVWKGDYNYRD